LGDIFYLSLLTLIVIEPILLWGIIGKACTSSFALSDDQRHEFQAIISGFPGKGANPLSTKRNSVDARDSDASDADWKFRQTAAQFTRGGYAIAGALSSALLTRCAEEATSIHDIRGKIEALIANDRERSGFAVAVSGRLGLMCQSCGTGFELSVDSQSTIYVARDIAELERWEEESFESIEASEKTSALELVEDELLLAIPYVPRCEKCSAAVAPKIHEFN
jgi:uncharacterized protein